MKYFRLRGSECKEGKKLKEVLLFAKKWFRDGKLSIVDAERLISLGPEYADEFDFLTGYIDREAWEADCVRHRRMWVKGR